MRLLFKVCVAFALFALVLAPARAQFRPGGGGGLGTLLTNKSVQEELKLDKDQITKLEEVTKKFREDHKDDYDKLRNRDTKQEERAEIQKKLNEEQTKLVKEIVKPEQMTRVKQIQLQQSARFAGVSVFASEEVQKELKLTDKQKDDIKTIGDDIRKDLEDLRKDAGMDRTKLREVFQKAAQMNKDAMEKVQKTFTEDQKKAWKEMTGEPFEVKFERPAGGTGNRGNGNGRGRPGDNKTEPRKIDF